MFFMFQPSGKMEDYFRKLATFTGPPTPEEGAKLFSDYDMKVVGPPLSLWPRLEIKTAGCSKGLKIRDAFSNPVDFVKK